MLDLLIAPGREVAGRARRRRRALPAARNRAAVRAGAARRSRAKATRPRTRHLAFYLALAETGAAGARRARSKAKWLARLDLERENLLAAHAWCDYADGRRRARAAARLRAAALLVHSRAARARVSDDGRGARRPGAQTRDLSRCEGCSTQASSAVFMGRYAEARTYLEESLAIAREIGDKERRVQCCSRSASLRAEQGELAARGDISKRRSSSRESSGDKREIAAALNALAQLHRVGRRAGYGRAALRGSCWRSPASWAIARASPSDCSISRWWRSARGSARARRRMLLEVLAIADEIGSKPAGQSALEVSAGLAGATQEWADAARFFGAAEAQAAQTGLHRDPADEAFPGATDREDPGSARRGAVRGRYRLRRRTKLRRGDCGSTRLVGAARLGIAGTHESLGCLPFQVASRVAIIGTRRPCIEELSRGRNGNGRAAGYQLVVDDERIERRYGGRTIQFRRTRISL